MGRRALTSLALALILLLVAGPAAAHTSLLSSQPRDGATLTKAPRVVVLTFSEPLQDRGAGFAVTGPQGTTPVAPEITGASARFPWPPGFTAGRFTVAYRVVSVDGHVVEDQVRFSVEGKRSATSQPVAPPAQPGSPSQAPGGLPWWGWVGIVLLAAGAGVAIWRVRTQPRRPVDAQ